MLEQKYTPVDGRLASAILDHVRSPMFLVTRDAGVRYSNAAGVEAIKEGHSFREADDALCAAHPADNSRLRSAIASTCTSRKRQTLMINDARSLRPHLVTVIPFEEEEPASELGAIVFAQRCEPSDEVFTSSLRQMFRLSAAEMAIAAALVSGADVEHIAEMRNAKITTVRTQIAAMLLKTRTRRQGELVALFSRICALP
jgi:DNA-binding CsgD family transcriptional regulator